MASPPAPGPAAPPGFLDAASGQPLNPAAREAWLAAADAGWSDPKRLYREGRRAALLAQASLEALAQDLAPRAEDLLVTSCGGQAYRSIFDQLIPPHGTLVVSAVEHSAILSAADRVADRGGTVHVVGVDRSGRVDADDFVAAAAHADLACLQAANHEVGTCQPMEEVAEGLRVRGVPLLVDATMALGRIVVPDVATVLVGRATSWGGPPGIDVVVVQDRGMRSRLELPRAALPDVMAAARGWEWARAHRDSDARAARVRTDRLRERVMSEVPDVMPLGDPVRRLPHLFAFSCLYVDGEALVLGLDREGFAISSGSSCVSDTRRPSHVLSAMGALTQGNVRVSLPFGVSDETLDGFADTLPSVVREVRALVQAPMEDHRDEG